MTKASIPSRLLIRVKKTRLLWGEAAVGLALLLALIRVATERPPGHYRMYIEASKALWSSGEAYGVPFLGNLFFFSPSCALFLYGPFALLPEIPGVFLYTLLSGGLFIFGVRRVASHYVDRNGLQWFWLLVASQLYSGLAAHKPEVLSMGVLFLSAAWLIEGKHLPWAAFFLAMVGNFKLQPLPAVALLALVVVLIRSRRGEWRKLASWIFVAILGLSFLFWFGAPWLVRPFGYLAEQHGKWFSTLSGYSAASFDFYDNSFAFLHNNFGLQLTYGFAQNCSMFLAAVSLGLVVYWCKKRTRLELKPFHHAILLALVLGTTYTVLVSPLQQVSAYILLSPLMLALAVLRSKEPRRFTALMLLSFVIWSLGYSDLVPEPAHEIIRHAVVRVPMTWLALVAVVLRLYQPRALPNL